VADSGALYALYDKRDRNHGAVRETLRAEPGPIIIPAAIVSEIDYLLRVRIGLAAEQRFLEGLEKGAFMLEAFTLEDVMFCRKLLVRYKDLDLGLADASVVATAERLGIYTILTVDERDFRAVRTAKGEAFVLWPADRDRGGRST
jgi:predicted nucleic acid-binding protein